MLSADEVCCGCSFAHMQMHHKERGSSSHMFFGGSFASGPVFGFDFDLGGGGGGGGRRSGGARRGAGLGRGFGGGGFFGGGGGRRPPARSSGYDDFDSDDESEVCTPSTAWPRVAVVVW